jgi:transcriptional regulator with XRE-family HTH domain
MLTSEQCRAARGLIDWSREKLAEASMVSHRTIVDFERGARDPREVTKGALRRALEAEGVIFQADKEMVMGGPGVRLKGE